MDRRKKAATKTSSDPQTDSQSVVAESLQVQESQQTQEAFIFEQAKSVARELGTSVAHIVKKKTIENAQKVLEFTDAIQSTAAAEVGEMLKSTMQVKREQGGS
jgi:ATP-dependent Lon protease